MPHNVVVNLAYFVLALIIIATAFAFMYPYVQSASARQKFDAVLKAAIAISNAIDNVVQAGVNSSTTVSINLPDNAVVKVVNPSDDYNGSIIFTVYGGPPYQGTVIAYNGSLSWVCIVPKGTYLEVQVNTSIKVGSTRVPPTDGWNITAEGGLSRAGQQNTVRIDYLRPYVVGIKWNP
jgi:type II secretory pathway pseudopilin PulG